MRRCRAVSGYGKCGRPKHEDRTHAVLIGGGSDPFVDPQVWFQWGRDVRAGYVACRPEGAL